MAHAQEPNLKAFFVGLTLNPLSIIYSLNALQLYKVLLTVFPDPVASFPILGMASILSM